MSILYMKTEKIMILFMMQLKNKVGIEMQEQVQLKEFVMEKLILAMD